MFDQQDGSSSSTSSARKIELENNVLVDASARFAMAPDEDDDEIEVAPRCGSSSSVSISIGQELLKSMAQKAKTENPEAIKAMANASKNQVPMLVGGFLGAGGAPHDARSIAAGATGARIEAKQTPSSASAATRKAVTFKRDCEISEEEAQFGGIITDATVHNIFKVLRVASDGQAAEVLFADGTREKLATMEIRAGTRKEVELFESWAADPKKLPTSSREKRLRQQDVDGVGNELLSSMVPPASQWWVNKGLIVRCVVDGHESEGKKFVVSSVAPKEDRVVLTPWVDPNTTTSSSSASTSATIVILRQRDLETVLPKQGEVGLVLRGPHRGSLARLVRRIKPSELGSGENGAASVEIALAVEGKETKVMIDPDDYCAFLQKARP